MTGGLRLRLRMMMFLQMFSWGAWYATTGNYMASHGMSEAIYWAYTVGPFSAVVAPFFLGVIADRFLPAERLLGVLSIAGSFPMFAASLVPDGRSGIFLALLLMHTLCHFSGLGLTSALAFHHITDRERQFTGIRVFGTVGWMAAGVLVSYVLKADQTPIPLQIAAGSAFLFGLYSFTLPHTPPAASGERFTIRRILGLDALRRLHSRSFAIFLLSIFLLSIPLSTYYAYGPIYLNAAGMSDPAFKMAFNQLSEIVVMFLMPLFLVRLDVKKLYMIGMAAWLLRFSLFGLAAVDGVALLIFTGILLHGICFNFTFISGQIYVDRLATPAIRAQAQGLMVMVNTGLGLMTGAIVSGNLFNLIVGGAIGDLGNWRIFWGIQGAVVVVVLLVFGLFFRPEVRR